MGKGKQNKSRNEPQQNVAISEPDFSVKSETLTPAEKKLRAQQERERRDAEEAAQLRQRQIAEQKKKNTKTKPKQKNNNKQTTKKSEPDVDINEVNEEYEINEDYVESVKEMSLKEQETNDYLEKTTSFLNPAPNENNWRRKHENVSKPNYSSSPSFNNRRSTGSYSYNFNDGKNDKDFQDCLKRSAGKSSGKVREEIGDLETNDYLEKTTPFLNPAPNENNWRTKHENVSKPNYSSSPSFNNRRSTGSYSYNLNDGKNDKDFQDCLKRAGKSSGKVREEIGDLFDAPEDYSLAHCVAEDFSMGAGIAKEFKAKFKSVAKLLEQRASTGGLAFLEHKSRFIYYLVTKKASRGKPTLYTLWQSLIKMYEHIVANNITKLAIPQIGCGLDRLDWDRVKSMIEDIFHGVKIDIVVYILEYNANETLTPSRPLKKCHVFHGNMPLVEIQTGTGLIFLGTEDGFLTPEINSLATKYDFVNRYKNARKSTGDVIKIIDRDEYLYGLIIKQKHSDRITFSDFEKCLYALQKMLKQDKTEYIGIQGFVEQDDEVITEKLVNLMQYHLKDVEIWVCWPKELTHLCPQKK